jgi:hypothetical protein
MVAIISQLEVAHKPAAHGRAVSRAHTDLRIASPSIRSMPNEEAGLRARKGWAAQPRKKA